MSRMDRTMLAVAHSSFRRLGLLVGLPVVLGALGACSTQASVENPENLGQQAGAITQDVPPDLSFNAAYPAGLGMSTVAVGAREKLELEPRARVNGLNALPGTVTSATDSIEVQPSAAVGQAVAGDDIRVGPRANVVSAKAGNQVNVQPQAIVGSVTNHAVVTPLVERSFVVAVPPGPPQIASLVPHAVTVLLPGRFKDVNVGSGSTLKLSSGTYVVDSFDLSSDGLIDLDTSGGSVYLYVKEHARWRGGLGAGDPSRFVFGYLGGDTLEISGAFGGTALAPHGTLSILAKQHVRGSFYGERVVVGPDAVVDQLPPPFVIDNFTVSKTSLCTGEAAEVNVVPAVAGAEVAIQLMPGPQQFVQFSGYPGDRLVFATVKTPDGRAEAVTQHVTLGACQTPEPLTFHFTGKIGRPNTVSFLVKGYDGNGQEVAAPAPATYQWTFGDGGTATTASPLVDHDYSPAVHPLDLHTYFTAQVSVTSSAGTTLIKRVIPIFSLYALNRAKGVIRPPSAVAVTAASYTVTVNNVESTPLSLASARFDLSPCDPALASVPQPPQVLSVVVPAGGSANVVLDAPTFTADICSIDLHVMGASSAGEVYADHYFRTRENPLLTRDVTESSTVALLNTASTLTADPNRFTESELQELVARGALASMPPAIGGSGVYGGDGAECTPGDIDPTGALACQPVAQWKAVPSVILNGRKGDLVMDHGCGSVGQLVGAIGQQYSHTSMLVDRGVTIRHSTSSQRRVEDPVVHGGGVGFDPDKLRYGYPGTEGSKTHTIDEMVKSYTVYDPIDLSPLAMVGELSPDVVSCPGVDVTPVPGLIVGPTPDKLADSTSQALMQLTVTEAGKIDSHYRFFQYSRADLPAPGGGTWATGKPGTVCSSFERLAASNAGAKLWPKNTDPTSPPDGMRSYTVDERLAAGIALYSNTYDTVIATAHEDANPLLGFYVLGVLVGILPPVGPSDTLGAVAQMAMGMANQLANCFASDQCGDPTPAWRATGKGIALGVDDILSWDTPAKGGTYGYNEPFAYVPTYYRHKYVWNRVQGVGAIRAVVYHQDGTPCLDAVADVDGLALGTTDAQGLSPQITIATGMHVATAARLQCGQLEDPKPKPLPRIPNVVPQQLPACDAFKVTDLTACTSAPNGSCPATACQTASLCPKGWKEGAAWFAPPVKVCDSSNPEYPLCSYSLVRECKLEVPQCSGKPWVSSRLVNLSSAPLTTVPIRLCDASPPNNATNSCPQPCGSDSDCLSGWTCDYSQATLSYAGLCKPEGIVGITEKMTGPNVCVKNGVFTNGGPVTARFDNLPWRGLPNPTPITLNATADVNGNVWFVPFVYPAMFACGSVSRPDVQVTFTDIASLSPPWTRTIDYTYFCPDTLIPTDYNGGCN